MDILNQIHTLYQYSLQYFLDIFYTVLTQNSNLKDIKDHQQRLKIIAKDLFYLGYYRLSRGMLHEDRIVLALLFSKIYLKGFTTQKTAADAANMEIEFRSLMTPYKTGLVSKDVSSMKDHSGLSAEQSEALVHLSKMTAFKDLAGKISAKSEEFLKWIEHSKPEANIPESLW